MTPRSDMAAVILAGGKASRMKHLDKALLDLNGRPIIEFVIEQASADVDKDKLLLSVNHNPEKYLYLNIPIIEDYREMYGGPLIGIASAMRWLSKHNDKSKIAYLACFPADVPFFPNNLVSQLYNAAIDSKLEVACTICDEQIQPLFSVWSLSVLEKIEAAIGEGIYGPKLLIPQLHHRLIEIPQTCSTDFYNINDEASLQAVHDLTNKQ